MWDINERQATTKNQITERDTLQCVRKTCLKHTPFCRQKGEPYLCMTQHGPLPSNRHNLPSESHLQPHTHTKPCTTRVGCTYGVDVPCGRRLASSSLGGYYSCFELVTGESGHGWRNESSRAKRDLRVSLVADLCMCLHMRHPSRSSRRVKLR